MYLLALVRLRSAAITFAAEVATVTFAPKDKYVKKKNLSFFKTVFSCYDTFYTPKSLYRKVKHIAQLSVSKYGYTTYTSQEYNYIMPKGCLGFVVTKEKSCVWNTDKVLIVTGAKVDFLLLVFVVSADDNLNPVF